MASPKISALMDLARAVGRVAFPPSKRMGGRSTPARTTPPPSTPTEPTPAPRRSQEPGPRAGTAARSLSREHTFEYPGDFEGAVHAEYAPQIDGDPDPGEIVWTWVPFEEDFAQGKDRPVLLVGHDGPWLLGVMLTSKDHSRDRADEERWGRFWLDIGAGPWDPRGRDSEVRLDRVIRIDPDAVRREGAMLDKPLFDRVLTDIAHHR